MHQVITGILEWQGTQQSQVSHPWHLHNDITRLIWAWRFNSAKHHALKIYIHKGLEKKRLHATSWFPIYLDQASGSLAGPVVEGKKHQLLSLESHYFRSPTSLFKKGLLQDWLFGGTWRRGKSLSSLEMPKQKRKPLYISGLRKGQQDWWTCLFLTL